MKTLSRSDIPADFTYYRTWSRVFYEYYKKYFVGMTMKIGKGYEYIKAWKILGLPFWMVIAEKVDIEPKREFLSKNWIRHGIVYWAPYRQMQKPLWWIRLPTWITKSFLHSSRSAFSILDTDDHTTKWSSEARNHLKKVRKNIATGVMRIELCEDLQMFYDTYTASNIRDPNKGVHKQWCRRMLATGWIQDKRIYLGYVGDEIVAGALFIDEGVTSEYYMSFYNPASRPYQFGIAFMDRWFSDSREWGFKYCDLDHMHEPGQPTTGNTKWYTKFKEWIADFDAYFHDMWMKIF